KGLKAIETDLGELILQLNEEPPLHIVVPAIHRNRHEIGEIFKEKLGANLENDEPESLNAVAREHLRKDFEGLKLGLSGVNFAMSREGAFWLIENEGNGRMCTTAPDIHIALCG
ncbi:lactate utilization protein, partial [Escherichia coli]|nr:lactate utilization protein [Escherichia coli]